MPTPLRIQIQLLSPHHFLGGGAVHARGLAEGLRACGAIPTLLCTGAAQPECDRVYERIDCVNPRARWGTWRLGPISQLPAWRRAIRETTRDVDAVVALGALPALADKLARPRLPLVFAPAILDRVEHPDTPFASVKLLESLAFRVADALQLTTAPVRDAVQQLYGPLNKPIGLAPLGLHAPQDADPDRVRRAHGIPAHAPLLLTMGLLNENKGQRHIAAALRELFPHDWWWAIVGTGPDRELLARLLAGTPWERRTIFVSADPRPQDWHAAADLFAIASRHETFGLVVGEALRSQTPVITPRHELPDALGPLAPLIEEHQLGWTFPRNDEAALRATLQAALNAGDRPARGRRAAAFTAAHFGWEAYSRSVLGLLSSEPIAALRDSELPHAV